MTVADSKEIQAWLDSERNYDEGVRLFALHSKNSVLKRIFPNKEGRYAGRNGYVDQSPPNEVDQSLPSWIRQD